MTAPQASPRSHVTTHVLDASRGTSAAGLEVQLDRTDDGEATGWARLATATTDADGRVWSLGAPRLAPGTYRLTFMTGAWFCRHDRPTFYPQVCVTFEVCDEAAPYHLPLLLSPFAYSTSRGS